MKIATEEEKKAHNAFVLSEGTKGFLIGGLTAVGVFAYVRRYHLVAYKSFTPSVKAALFIMPTAALCSFWAEEGSRLFDMELHGTEDGEAKLMKEYYDWKDMSLANKLSSSAFSNRFKILFGLYGLTFFGAQEYGLRQATVQAQKSAMRNFSVASTVIFLGIISMMSSKDSRKDDGEWRKFLDKSGEKTDLEKSK